MGTQLIQRFRQKLSREAVIGPFAKTSDPALVEAMGLAGMDFVVLDLEHGSNDICSLGGLIRAAECGGALPIVRVNEDSQIGRSLDQGAAGVQVPNVDSVDRARQVVEQAKFAPEGLRGVCRYVRAADYSAIDKDEYFPSANQALVVLQVEGATGLAALPEITAVPGVDVVFIGVYDLSQSLGMVGQIDHPDVLAGLAQAAELGRAQGVAVGTFVESLSAARRCRDQGIHYLGYSVDVGLMLGVCQGIVHSLTVPS